MLALHRRRARFPSFATSWFEVLPTDNPPTSLLISAWKQIAISTEEKTTRFSWESWDDMSWEPADLGPLMNPPDLTPEGSPEKGYELLFPDTNLVFNLKARKCEDGFLEIAAANSLSTQTNSYQSIAIPRPDYYPYCWTDIHEYERAKKRALEEFLEHSQTSIIPISPYDSGRRQADSIVGPKWSCYGVIPAY